MNAQQTHGKVTYLYSPGKWKLKTRMKYHFTPTKKAKMKRLIISYAGKFVEQLERSHTVVESVKSYTDSQELFGNFS